MERWIPVLILAFTASCAPPGPARAPASLPAVALATIDRGPVDLHSIIGGRAALVSLWASWCVACENEFPALNRLAASTDESTAVVIGIAVGEARETVSEFLRGHPSNYPQLIDEDFHFADMLGNRQVPATLVVDRSGAVIYAGAAMDRRALAAFRRAASGA